MYTDGEEAVPHKGFGNPQKRKLEDGSTAIQRESHRDGGEGKEAFDGYREDMLRSPWGSGVR